ncbi:MAG: Smr/MutS family protein [Bacteroidota bacterium]
MTGSKFKIGDLVGFLHEKGQGTIISRTGMFYQVLDEDGFDKKCPEHELIEIHGTDFPLSAAAYEKMQSDKKLVIKKSVDTAVPKSISHKQKKALGMWEIDIHAEELKVDLYGMTNGDIFNLQMKTLRAFNEKARLKEVRRLVVIHGVGEGILREEVRRYFTSFYGTTCADADIEEYGKGATEVFIQYE